MNLLYSLRVEKEEDNKKASCEALFLMGSVDIVLPSRDSARIANPQIDVANIRTFLFIATNFSIFLNLFPDNHSIALPQPQVDAMEWRKELAEAMFWLKSTASLFRYYVITLFRYDVITIIRESNPTSNIPCPIAFWIARAAPKSIACVFAFLGHALDHRFAAFRAERRILLKALLCAISKSFG